MVRKEAKEFAKYWGEIEAVGISRRPCPRCGGEVYVFFLSTDKIPISKIISMDEWFFGEADDFFKQERLLNPVLLSCSDEICGMIGHNWEELGEMKRHLKRPRKPVTA